jgi:Holliday junction resolvase RusA-like endonuclease
MSDWTYFVLDINPEPWAIGPLSVGRRGNKMYPQVGRNTQLHFYKQAVKEELGDPGVWFEGKVELDLYFWRRRDEYVTPQARTHRKHEADGTNLSKATEDALQGVLFKNDKDVVRCTWEIVDQGADANPAVVVGIRQFNGISRVNDLPDEVIAKLGETL